MKIYRLTDVVIEKERSSMPSSINFFILYTAQWVFNLFAYFLFWTFSWNSDSCVKKIKNVKKSLKPAHPWHQIEINQRFRFICILSEISYTNGSFLKNRASDRDTFISFNDCKHADFHSALHAAIALIFHSIVHLTMTRQDVKDSEQWDAVNCHVQHRLILFRYYFRYFTYNIYIRISYFKLLVDALSHFDGNSCGAMEILLLML